MKHELAKRIIEQAGVQGADVNRVLSYGKEGGKNMVNERASNLTMSFSLINRDAKSKVIVLGGANGIKASSLQSGGSIFQELGATHAFRTLEERAPGAAPDATPIFEIVGNDPGRSIDEAQVHFGQVPTRITSIQMSSEKADNSGTADTSNYSGELKTVFLNPFEENVTKRLQLRKFQSASQNSPEFMSIDFAKQQFPVILSHANLLLITVKPGTTLNVTLNIGAQYATNEYLYRTVKAADSVIPKVLGIEGCDC